jgi:hypothetical protein
VRKAETVLQRRALGEPCTLDELCDLLDNGYIEIAGDDPENPHKTYVTGIGLREYVREVLIT